MAYLPLNDDIYLCDNDYNLYSSPLAPLVYSPNYRLVE